MLVCRPVKQYEGADPIVRTKYSLSLIRKVNLSEQAIFPRFIRIPHVFIQVVSTLPDDIRPGPDLYGVPWEPVIISSLVGLMTMLLFSCRCYSSVSIFLP